MRTGWGPGPARLVATVGAGGYVALSILVAVGATQGLDEAARELFRPGDAWGRAQMRTGPIIDGLEPRRAFLLLLLVAGAVSLRRVSWRPMLYAALAAAAASALTVASKHAIGRPDPHLELFGGGSYPSGHMVADLLTAGGILWLLRQHTRWWGWCLVALVGFAMGSALLFAAAHWLTDIVGGVLLSVTLLAWLSTVPPSHDGADGTP